MAKPIRAIILLGTLKKKEQSNTAILSEFVATRFAKKKVECEIVKLTDYTILPGTYSDMGKKDEWPKILKKILASQLVVFATPVWWGGHASEIQRIIERLDELYDEILIGKRSRLEGKVGGVIITGDSDGAQHIIGTIANFFNAVGILLPPYASVSVLSPKLGKGVRTSRAEMIEMFRRDQTTYTDKMIEQMLKHLRR